MTQPSEFAVRISRLLERLGIRYQIGGSFASSAHGVYRTSADIDVVIDPSPQQLEALTHALQPDFYVSPGAVSEAMAHRSTFNAIDVATSFKVDFFIKGSHAYDEEELRRSLRTDSTDGPSVNLKSPEDTILRKLEWFRRGGEVSERQWRDVVEVLSVNHGRLDIPYLEHWAAELGLADLLARAMGESHEAQG